MLGQQLQLMLLLDSGCLEAPHASIPIQHQRTDHILNFSYMYSMHASYRSSGPAVHTACMHMYTCVHEQPPYKQRRITVGRDSLACMRSLACVSSFACSGWVSLHVF
jgi:hypothetical protein